MLDPWRVVAIDISFTIATTMGMAIKTLLLSC